ncbi:MAG: hypothetical protein J7M17_05870 [Anaerolineae bacterium]|nr:hypothetical protein [Anaerolineae bacterium]
MARRNGRDNSRDALDVLIRTTLHQSVRGAELSPRVWGRIEKRIRRMTAVNFPHPRPQSVFERRPALSPWLTVDIFHPLLSNGLRVL